MMPLGFLVYVGWMVLVALIAVAFLVWARRHGQFKDIEEAKYRMLEDREPEPWEKDGGEARTKDAGKERKE
jgi:cbb3-type cytochrome oxidase maturation protein